MNVLTGAWWSKPKVAVASGLLGLVVGLGGATESEPEEASDAEVQQLVDAQLDDRTAELEEQAEAAEAAAEDAEEALEEAAAAAEQDQERAVAAALAAERAKVEPTPEPTREQEPAPKPRRQKPQLVVTASDPLFDTCGEANDHGYGNYFEGQDPEYDHYDDRDGDGVVCEF